MEDPLHSPDLVSVDFYLFPRLKSAFEGTTLRDAIVAIKNASKNLKRLSRNGFQECFQHIYSGWQKWIVAKRKHFEGNIP